MAKVKVILNNIGVFAGVGIVIAGVGGGAYMMMNKRTSGGFNASKTVFVLPHNLGDLPAPELALAKSDPAYAAGLLTPADWFYLTPTALDSLSKAIDPATGGWIYLGGDNPTVIGGPNISPLVDVKVSTITTDWPIWLSGIAHFSTTSSVPILDSRLNSYSLAPVASVAVSQGYTVVTPSVLEVRAAPVGTMSVNGTSVPAVCVPTPEGVLQNGQIATPGGISLTAGPSVVFTVTSKGYGALYDQGVSSCVGFN